MKHHEDDIQKALFQWITLVTPRIPQLSVSFHPANGGYRNTREAARLKGQGVRAGVPDVMIPARNGSADLLGPIGLAIELKAGKNKPTAEQLAWHERLRAQCWQVNVCYSFDEARAVIAEYFNAKP